MLYNDLVERTKQLGPGRHVIAELALGTVEIENVGVRHHYLTPRDEFRLLLVTGGKTLLPRHGDFLTDYLLKVECRPELRLALSDACDAVCNGARPSEVMQQKQLPEFFSRADDSTWTLQTTSYQSGGLPTQLYLHGLQGLIRVYELNDEEINAQEAFRQSFLDVQGGRSVAESSQRLRPRYRSGKRYFDGRARA